MSGSRGVTTSNMYMGPRIRAHGFHILSGKVPVNSPGVTYDDEDPDDQIVLSASFAMGIGSLVLVVVLGIVVAEVVANIAL